MYLSQQKPLPSSSKQSTSIDIKNVYVRKESPVREYTSCAILLSKLVTVLEDPALKEMYPEFTESLFEIILNLSDKKAEIERQITDKSTL